jgi:hypothetical protein
MKFSVLVAILSEEFEERAIDVARQNGAAGVTILGAKGIGSKEKKTFFGLTVEGSQSVLVFVLERKLSVQVLKSIDRELSLAQSSCGVVFTVPLEHIAGIDMSQVHQFEDLIKNEI